MPYIEEEDLVALHKKIERAKDNNQKLQDQITEKNRDYDQSVRMRNMAWGLTSILSLAIIGMAYYFHTELSTLETTYASCYEKNTALLQRADSTDYWHRKVALLEKENSDLERKIREYDDLPPSVAPRDSVYTVQVKAFETKQIPLQSNTNFINTQNRNMFYAFCIGTFDTAEEARILQSELVHMGFTDAFVALYKDGQRQKIIEQ
ncbi:hypothetical protein [Sinomicrobium soli]|uniref:hypothetical protein n=1 Tax=Sinomicrobium sp. N-1-3-6 TaxID=2219864 RepID=UPI000DCBDE43|nr:hypothetical protein [Sinomicrobium sp. N-1-3-6]RAV29674.1 hypothetical protein DN748_06025 [Sinomicrobium sp. N-1-3-6]